MRYCREILLPLVALCAIASATGIRIDDTVRSDLMLQSIPGKVSGQLLATANTFINSIIVEGKLKETLIYQGEHLERRLSRLSDNGKNLKATILLMNVLDWSAQAFRSANKPIEAAIRVDRFIQMCSKYVDYCTSAAIVRARLEQDDFMKSREAWEILSLEDFVGRPLKDVRKDADEAIGKYRSMLDAEHKRILDRETRTRYDELLAVVEKAYEQVTDENYAISYAV